MTSTVNPDYWALLGLAPGSSPEELKVAFRREARRWHPDLNANSIHAEERFKLVNEAYKILSDPRKRSIWEKNNLKLQDESLDFTHGFPEFYEYISNVLGIDTPVDDLSNQNISNDVDEEDDFLDEEEEHESNFRWPSKSHLENTPVQAFDDIETTVNLDPQQALLGTNIEIELQNGTVVEVSTPPFAGDGWRLRLEGVAPGGRDHFLQLRVITSEGLRIDGLRVLYRLELFPADAVLGCAVDVPTLLGPVTLQVPPGSSSGRLLRLRGRGMEFEDRKGDQLVEIVVVVPNELSDSEQALYERLQELALERELD